MTAFGSLENAIEAIRHGAYDYLTKPFKMAEVSLAIRRALDDPGHGFDAGAYYCDASYSNLAEAVTNYLKNVGIQTELRPLERAAFFAQYREKKLGNIVQVGSGAFGNEDLKLKVR